MCTVSPSCCYILAYLGRERKQENGDRRGSRKAVVLALNPKFDTSAVPVLSIYISSGSGVRHLERPSGGEWSLKCARKMTSSNRRSMAVLENECSGPSVYLAVLIPLSRRHSVLSISSHFQGFQSMIHTRRRDGSGPTHRGLNLARKLSGQGSNLRHMEHCLVPLLPLSPPNPWILASLSFISPSSQITH